MHTIPQTMNKMDLIEAIQRALIAAGNTIQRSHDGRYVYINHGCNSYYDDLQFFLRQWAFEVRWQEQHGAATVVAI